MLRKISEFLAVPNLSSSAPNYQDRLPSAVRTPCVWCVVVVFYRGGATFKLSPVVSELPDRDSGTCSLRSARRKNHPRFNPQRASCIQLFVCFCVFSTTFCFFCLHLILNMTPVSFFCPIKMLLLIANRCSPLLLKPARWSTMVSLKPHCFTLIWVPMAAAGYKVFRHFVKITSCLW